MWTIFSIFHSKTAESGDIPSACFWTLKAKRTNVLKNNVLPTSERVMATNVRPTVQVCRAGNETSVFCCFESTKRSNYSILFARSFVYLVAVQTLYGVVDARFCTHYTEIAM